MATRILVHGLLLAACICAAAAQYADGPAPPRLIVPGAVPVPAQGASRPRFLSGRQRRPQQAPVVQQPAQPAYLPTPAADLVEVATPQPPPTLPPRPVEEEPEEYDDDAGAPTPPPARPVRPPVRPQEQPQFRQQRPIAVQVSSPVGISVADIPVSPPRQAPPPRPAVFRPERPLQVSRQQQPNRPQELPPQIFRQPPQQPQGFRQPQQPSRPAVEPQQVFRQPQQPSRPAVEPQQVFRQPQQPSRPAVEPPQVFRQPQQPQQYRPQPQQARPQPKQQVKQQLLEDDDDEEQDVPRQHIRQKVQQPPVGVRQQQQQQAHPRPSHVPNKVQRERKPVAQVLRKYREDNPDGSITWGYENDDGSFKEETIGVDCVVSGKYGYVDPDGVRREYTYSSGTPCDKTLEAEEAAAGGVGGSGGGYMDYETGEFILPGGQIVDMRGVNKHKSRRPANANYGK